MKARLRTRSCGLALAVGIGICRIACDSHVTVADSTEGQFLALNQTAMSRKMAGMTVRPVNAIGPIRQIVQSSQPSTRQYLVILPGTPDNHGTPAQVQVAS